MMIDKKHPLATVRDSFNAVFVHGDAVGDTMFYGRGAGELPTASAVVGDVMDVTRNIVWNCTGRIGWSAYKELPIKEFADVKNRFFIRMQVSNEPGVLAAIAKVFGDHKVSIERDPGTGKSGKGRTCHRNIRSQGIPSSGCTEELKENADRK